jgi:hypothetical protein
MVAAEEATAAAGAEATVGGADFVAVTEVDSTAAR